MRNENSTPDAFRYAALDGAAGAVFGLLVIFAVVASSSGIGDALAVGRDLASWLALVSLVIVGQFALAGGLCGFAVRRYAIRR
jgi:hypothetical protein